jgi:hypothetical protein
MQLTRNDLLVLVGLSGSERLSLSERVRGGTSAIFRIRQLGRLCQMMGRIEGWKDSTQEGLLIVRISIFDNSYNYPGSYHRNKYYINGHVFHNFASFLVIGLAFRWVNYNKQRGGNNRKKV